MRRTLFLLPLLVVAACSTPRPPVVQVSQPAPAPVAAGPSILIEAPAARVRQTIAARTAARGGKVAANTSEGIVLEGPMRETTQVLADQCGPHQEGRLQRVLLGTQSTPGGTIVTEQRFIVDGPSVCQVRLTDAETDRANASLQDLRKQVLGQPTAAQRAAAAARNAPPPSMAPTPQR